MMSLSWILLHVFCVKKQQQRPFLFLLTQTVTALLCCTVPTGGPTSLSVCVYIGVCLTLTPGPLHDLLSYIRTQWTHSVQGYRKAWGTLNFGPVCDWASVPSSSSSSCCCSSSSSSWSCIVKRCQCHMKWPCWPNSPWTKKPKVPYNLRVGV